MIKKKILKNNLKKKILVIKIKVKLKKKKKKKKKNKRLLNGSYMTKCQN